MFYFSLASLSTMTPDGNVYKYHSSCFYCWLKAQVYTYVMFHYLIHNDIIINSPKKEISVCPADTSYQAIQIIVSLRIFFADSGKVMSVINNCYIPKNKTPASYCYYDYFSIFHKLVCSFKYL